MDKHIEVKPTPAANWRQEGQADPHNTRYQCERADLAMGQLTDDEIANAVFLCDHLTSFDSIVYLTAAKDRIRWLSRSNEALIAKLEAAQKERDEFKRYYKTACADWEETQQNYDSSKRVVADLRTKLEAAEARLLVPVKLPEKLQWSYDDITTKAEVYAFNNGVSACEVAISKAGYPV